MSCTAGADRPAEHVTHAKGVSSYAKKGLDRYHYCSLSYSVTAATPAVLWNPDSHDTGVNSHGYPHPSPA